MADAGHNNPPEAAELFKEEIERLREKADLMASQGITEDNAGAARDVIGLAGQLSKDIDAKRKEVKQPHLDAGREIDGTYNPLVSEAKDCVKTLRNALQSFVVERERKAEEARREAERKAAEEAEKARQFENDPLLGEDSAAQAKAAEAEARLVAAEAKQASSIKGSDGFRAMGTRIKRYAEVTSFPALIAHYAGHPDMKEMAEKLANADIRHAKGEPIEIPGVKIIEEKVLA
ncbi:hypothetical protein [Henriciella pelagia]|uniref:hypothetical protein n=1 Tax=Henriciella pelagia TaxID=1977912 RepID=UPI0035121D05